MLFILFLICIFNIININCWKIGAGIYDITPSCTQVGFMGYGNPSQSGTGIHMRLFARAFVIVDDAKPNDRVAYVTIEAAMLFHETKELAMQLLRKRFGSLYNHNNTMISSTHTHSGPGGFTYFALYDITTWGYQKFSLTTVANGIAEAIALAHSNLKSNASIRMATGDLISPQSNINRSPSAYIANPAAERAQYKYDVDKRFTLLRFDTPKEAIGLATWFAVHGTSMNNTNTLVSSDNKGYAALMFEKHINGNNSLPGRGAFVASFSNANEGDVSPNTKGAFCNDGSPCEFAHSTCGGKSEGCHGYGPGDNMVQSTRIIGQQQLDFAKNLYKQPKLTKIDDSGLRYVHTFVNMGKLTVSPSYSGTGKSERTCPGALGDAFAAGTTDGPGMFNFKQGTNSSSTNPFWNIVGQFLHEPSKQQVQCQYPKPILLDTGEMTFPAHWSANVVPLQLFALGKGLVIIGAPAEFTTMSGRRLRATVLSELQKWGFADNSTRVVIAGLSNQYTHYVTTREEYHVQRYEGASTLFGQFTLAAYQEQFALLARALARGTAVPSGTPPPDLSATTFDVLPPVVVDEAPHGDFGAVKTQPAGAYSVDGSHEWPTASHAVVSVEFWSADPRGHPLVNASYVEVQREVANGQWQTVLTDGDWDTRFHWRRHGIAESIATVEWHPVAGFVGGSLPATFRIVHTGYHKRLLQSSKKFTGISQPFKVTL